MSKEEEKDKQVNINVSVGMGFFGFWILLAVMFVALYSKAGQDPIIARVADHFMPETAHTKAVQP